MISIPNKPESKEKTQDENWLISRIERLTSEILSSKSRVQILNAEEIFLLVHENKYGNGDVFERLHYLLVPEVEKEMSITFLYDWKIIGILWLQPSPYNEDTLWLKHLSIDKAYKNRGISKVLMYEMFEYISQSDFTTLELSSYSKEWEEFVAHNLENKIWPQYPNLRITTSSGRIIQEGIKS